MPPPPTAARLHYLSFFLLKLREREREFLFLNGVFPIFHVKRERGQSPSKAKVKQKSKGREHESFINKILISLSFPSPDCPYAHVAEEEEEEPILPTNLSWRSMAALEDETEDVCSDIYVNLGLKPLRKGIKRNPRVLSLLSSLMERSVRRSELLMEATTQRKDNNSRTIFHGLQAPTLSIRCYINRIFKYFGCSPSCFVVAKIYVDRFLNCTEVQLTSLNVHRLLITSTMLAAKFIDDSFFKNAYYAKVGGVSTAELNRLEMKFLFSIDFRLQVSLQTFGRYCYQLEREATEAVQIERPIRACGVEESWSSKDESSSCASTIAR